MLSVKIGSVHRSNLKRYVLAACKRLFAEIGVKLYKNADSSAAVNIGNQSTLETGKSADLNVLTDLEEELLKLLFNGSARRGLSGLERIDIGRISLDNSLADKCDKILEVVGVGDKIGLGVDLNNSADIALNSGDDKALGGNSARLLGLSRETLLAKNNYSLFKIALSLDKCLLAVHHADACSLAESGYVLSSNICHKFTSFQYSI